ncbi:SpoIIIAH-like family protein [Alteribacillus iranensis]|uniref:Stage III sporulation protein AH n=1 Tax=Alteribacillus iranensis TaxID=930128 RepID=A0A1I1ZH06_9BACI|nr:SpoIIIAH-like family protein [Alteribacillus iranensis]SFE31026.1 stage III sporulation protein AH [Alteribacillus iranensis]
MLLKKQTVWLMTMLSLTLVLAVYYITSPNEMAEDQATEEGAPTAASEEEWVEWLSDEEMEATIEETEPTEGEEQAATVSEGSSNLFSELRLEREETRSRLREEYTEAIASEDFTAAEKSEAFDKREELESMQQKESLLENLIQSEGYSDAVVLSDEGTTRIIVEAEQLDPDEAVNLNRLAKEQLGTTDVVIGHQSAGSK